MKIATWNIERLKHKTKIEQINSILSGLNADILVLTETDSNVELRNYQFCIQTPKLREILPDFYSETENKVTIYTNYKIVRHHETYDNYTSLCVELETELGNIVVYGTIIGIFGNRHKSFKSDLMQQINNYKELSKENNLCVIGDYNISFADNYYYTNDGRNKLLEVFNDCAIKLLTIDRTECIDHIAISEKLLTSVEIEIDEWNYDKKLSDHKGISANIKSYNSLVNQI